MFSTHKQSLPSQLVETVVKTFSESIFTREHLCILIGKSALVFVVKQQNETDHSRFTRSKIRDLCYAMLKFFKILLVSLVF